MGEHVGSGSELEGPRLVNDDAPSAGTRNLFIRFDQVLEFDAEASERV